MEKLYLQEFKNLKQEIIELSKYEEAYNQGESLSAEQEEQFLTRYKEIIKILSAHDLSDIDFEEWNGMLLFVDEDIPIDFSKTRANLDFAIIEYERYKKFPNFRSCKIKNFDFQKNEYNPEMFDEEYIQENEGHFLSQSIPKEIADRFYNGKLTLKDIKNYPELAEKFENANLHLGLRYIYEKIGREKFCKLDADFIDATQFEWETLLSARPDLKTAEEVMQVLYESAREQIIGYSNKSIDYHFYYSQELLGDKFKEQNPDLFLSDETPENIRTEYYNHLLSLQNFSDNLRYFDGKKVAHAFSSFGNEKKIIDLYGEELYKLFTDYKPMLDEIIDDYDAMFMMEVPSGPITEEQRKEIMSLAILNHFHKIENIQILKMITDFVPIERLPFNDKTKEFLTKYDIDKLIDADFDLECLTTDKTISNLDELKKLEAFMEPEDIQGLLNSKDRNTIKKYGIDKLLEYGIQDFTEISEQVKNLHKIKKIMEQRPIDLINLGAYPEEKISFIKKYGIDNIIALDEETNGMFSHELWKEDIYLTLFANTEGNAPKFEPNEKLSYEDFKNRMYEILLYARDERGPLRSKDYIDYDFIQGDFRKEHSNIFINGDISPELKRKFYFGSMNAEDIRQDPEVIPLLKDKDLKNVFRKKMIAGLRFITKR